MGDSPPTYYLLNGEDEFAIAQFIADLKSKLGDSATVTLNTTYLDGRNSDMAELLSVASAMPFLAKRRLVVLTNPLALMMRLPDRQKVLQKLEAIPASTALVLIEHRTLTSDKERRQGKLHWLEKWAQNQGQRAYLCCFELPKGGELAQWIQNRAKLAGGDFTLPAAVLLASLVDGNPRLADQEIHKLLAYVNYQRPVGPDDVEGLTADASQGDIFTLVDSLGKRDGRAATGMLRRLLERGDPFLIFGMVVRQFRLLLLTREILERGGGKGDIVSELKVFYFVAEKLLAQVRHFTLPDLEMVYHHLLDIDGAVKSSRMPIDLALEMFVAGITISPAHIRTSR